MKGNYATVLRITRFSATFDKSGLCCEFALNASQLVSKNLDFFEIMWDHCSTILLVATPTPAVSANKKLTSANGMLLLNVNSPWAGSANMCYICRYLGHLAQECPNIRDNNNI
ncbi:3157_t:CDS:2, partial [Entrophospora sp. SA101]